VSPGRYICEVSRSFVTFVRFVSAPALDHAKGHHREYSSAAFGHPMTSSRALAFVSRTDHRYLFLKIRVQRF
jgi:hypothetical protein